MGFNSKFAGAWQKAEDIPLQVLALVQKHDLDPQPRVQDTMAIELVLPPLEALRTQLDYFIPDEPSETLNPKTQAASRTRNPKLEIAIPSQSAPSTTPSRPTQP